MTSRSAARAFAMFTVAVAIGAVAVLAEAKGDERQPIADLLAGITLMVAGVALVARPSRRLRGILLVAAGSTWFATTAGIAVRGQTDFLHRALLVHAVCLTSLTIPRWREPARAVTLVATALAYVSCVGGDRAQSTPWVTTTGLVVVAATALVRPRWSFFVPAALGTGLWTVAAGIARTSGWWSRDTRFLVYVSGISLAAVAIVADSRRPTSSTTDIVRDGGPVGLVLGFRTGGEVEFTELASDELVVADPQRSRRLDLGELGEAIIVRPSFVNDDGRVERELLGAVRLLAAHRNALVATRRRASEIEAARARLALADARVAADLQVEVDRLVTRRIAHTLRVLDDVDSQVSRDARSALDEVLAEVHELVNGLAPRILERGLFTALLDLAARQPVPVDVEVTIENDELDAEVSAALYFAVAECLSNAVRHSAARSMVLRVDTTGDDVIVNVEDDGAGTASLIAGGGLDGLRRRLDAVRGQLLLDSGIGQGTTVTIRVPRAAAAISPR